MTVVNFPLTNETREWIERVDSILKSHQETLQTITSGNVVLGEWMRSENNRLTELERRVDMIMKATRHTPISPATAFDGQ